MSLVYLGSLALSAALPGASVALVAGIDGINSALSDIQARLTALASFSPSLGNFPADIALAQQIIAAIRAAIAAGLSPPNISAQIAIVAGLVAALQATVTQINAKLGIVVNLNALLTAAGVFVYAYDGPASALGGSLAFATSGGFPGGGPADNANAIILATTTPATWQAMRGVFKTS